MLVDLGCPARYLRVGTRMLAYEAPAGVAPDGPGLPAIFIHGSGMNRTYWRPTLQRLAAAGHRPIAVDMPGHGASEGPGIRNPEDAVDLVKGLHDALGLGPMILAGHSLGGAITQLYLVRHPGDVIAVGLISTAPRFNLSDEIIGRWKADPVALREGELAADIAGGARAEVMRELTEIHGMVTIDGHHADLDSVAAWRHPGDHTKIGVPALLVLGEHDTATMRSVMPGWAAALPDAELIEIAGAGHTMMVERAEETAAAIAGWAARIAARISVL